MCGHRNVVGEFSADVDGLTCVDIEVKNGLIDAIRPAKLKRSSISSKRGLIETLSANVLDLAGGIVFPTFADLHTHIGARRHGVYGGKHLPFLDNSAFRVIGCARPCCQ